MVKELADRGKTDMIDGAFCDKISVSLTWPMCWDSARKQLSTCTYEQRVQSFRVKKLHKLCFETKMTKVYSKNLLMKSSKTNLIFLIVFYLIICFMKAPMNFGKIVILEIWELISFGDVKTHIGKLALKWCIFRHETKICNRFWSD